MKDRLSSTLAFPISPTIGLLCVTCLALLPACFDGASGSCPSNVPRCDGEVLVECGRSGEVLPRNETSRWDCAAEGMVCVVEDGSADCVSPSREPCANATEFTRCHPDQNAVEICSSSVSMWQPWETCAAGDACQAGTLDDGSSTAVCAIDPLEACGDDVLASCRGDRVVTCDRDVGYLTATACANGCQDQGDFIDCD